LRPHIIASDEVAEATLPQGVVRYDLAEYTDGRGALIEIFRAEWPAAPRLLQLNYARSLPNVLRGVHVHPYSDWLVVISGRMSIGLFDARPQSSTFRLGAMTVLDATAPAALLIPNGVAHGFYSEEATSFVFGSTASWQPGETTVIRWDDAEMALRWSCKDPVISERDSLGISLAEALAKFGG
jgi:dTDP-4-dehydrorhamnose 3,5-epimerase